jgi:hypothetical protein
MQQDSQFSVDIKGKTTGQSYVGVFKIKTRLSMRDRLRQDEVRRTILGVNAESATMEAQGIANAVSYLNVRITKAPSWWTDNQGGLELEDMDVLAEVYQKAFQIEEESYKVLSDDAEKARQELKKADSV